MDKELKKAASNIKAQINIGKQGITSNLIESVDQYLEAHQMIKIKSFTALDKESLKAQAKEIAEETDSEIIDIKGHTFVLYRNQ